MNKVKESLFANGLLSMYSSTKSIAMTDNSLRVSSVLYECCRKTVTYQTELKNYDAIDIKNYESMCLYFYLGYLAGKSLPFYVALYCHVWLLWLYHIFQYYLIQGSIFKKKKIIKHKIQYLIFSKKFI